MPAGEFDRRIAFERAAITTDALGGEVTTWEIIARAWAKVTPVSDGEKWRAGQVEGRAISWFRVTYSRQRSWITIRDRIVFDGGVWSITGKKEIGRRRFLEFTAEMSDG